MNCTETCIPIMYSSLFNISEINVCKTLQSHLCARSAIWDYIREEQTNCMRPRIEKYFDGMATFKADFTNKFPNIITDERRKRTLLRVFWEYQSNLTTIGQENLVYDSKILLAWLGGVLGIFIGYSFFDFVKNIIDFCFYFLNNHYFDLNK